MSKINGNEGIENYGGYYEKSEPCFRCIIPDFIGIVDRYTGYNDS